MPNLASPMNVLLQVQGLVQSIAPLSGKTLIVYDKDNLMDKVKGAAAPYAAIIYNGMTEPIMRKQYTSGRLGLSKLMYFSIMVVQSGTTLVSTDTKAVTIDLLQSVRDAILGVRSVTGHFYCFEMEAPAETKNGLIFWAQRWSVPIQLSPVVGNLNQ